MASASSSRVPSGSTVPFTPRPRKTSKSNVMLSDKDFKQFVGTLASVHRVKPGAILEEMDLSGDVAPVGRRRTEGTASRASSAAARPSTRIVSTTSTVESRASSSRHRENPTASSSRDPQPPSSAASSSRPASSSSIHRSEALLEAEERRSRNGKQPERYKEPERERVITVQVEVGGDEDDVVEERERLLDDVPLEIQEAWVCEDIMFVLQGIEGTLIRYEEGYDPLDEAQRIRGARWSVDPSLDPSLLSVVERLLPLATSFTSVEAYMELRNSPENGMVSHALGSGIRAMLKEYRILAAQLESLFLHSATFTLQTLYFHLHPTLHTMSLLSSLCLSLEVDDATIPALEGSDDEDDGLGGMMDELGLGGAALKGLMKNMNAQEGFGGGGPVLGGEVLGIICEREATMSGDPTAATLNSTLLLHASQPYYRMLVRWITTGYLADPFEEFMVKESGHITKGVLESDYTDEYWERRYTLRDGSSLASSSKVAAGKTPALGSGVPPPRTGTTRLPGGACIPSFLQPWKHKILLAGKYLNVIKECGIEVKKPGEVDEGDGMIVMNEPMFYKRIEDAYIYANKTLLRLMLEEQQLIPHLRSMKHFFFLDQSDFLTNFLDLASSELRKPAKSASLVKLQSLLDLAIRNPASSSSADPYKEDLKVTMQSQGLYEWLLKIVSRTGGLTEDGELDFAVDQEEDVVKKAGEKERVLLAIDALALDYSVKFPLSLVISRKTITRYQLIFRFLLHLHHLESALSNMWLEHKAPHWRSPNPGGSEDMDRWKKRIFSLRARMLDFVRQVLAFATGEVLETQWIALEKKLAKVQTVDQLLRDHVDFLDTCLKQCMLTTSKLLGVYAKLMTTMSAFVSYQSSFNTALTKFIADPEAESDAAKTAQRWNVLQKFEINFNHHTKLHLDAVTYNAGSENVALLALVTRLHQTTLRI